jgi:hypothetical protein
VGTFPETLEFQEEPPLEKSTFKKLSAEEEARLIKEEISSLSRKSSQPSGSIDDTSSDLNSTVNPFEIPRKASVGKLFEANLFASTSSPGSPNPRRNSSFTTSAQATPDKPRSRALQALKQKMESDGGDGHQQQHQEKSATATTKSIMAQKGAPPNFLAELQNKRAGLCLEGSGKPMSFLAELQNKQKGGNSGGGGDDGLPVQGGGASSFLAELQKKGTGFSLGGEATGLPTTPRNAIKGMSFLDELKSKQQIRVNSDERSCYVCGYMGLLLVRS